MSPLMSWLALVTLLGAVATVGGLLMMAVERLIRRLLHQQPVEPLPLSEQDRVAGRLRAERDSDLEDRLHLSLRRRWRDDLDREGVA